MKTLKAKYQVRGGVHPQYHKDIAAESPLEELPLQELLSVSMAQHLGAPATPIVNKGDTVLRGQLIAEPAGFISAAIHAPTSGGVKSILPGPTATGANAPTITIEADGEDKLDPEIVIPTHWQEMDAQGLIAMVSNAGIVGMGGAGFPTHVKLSPPPAKKIDTLIINGAECEPYLTADYRLMIERPDDIRRGIEVMRHILGVKSVWIAIEDNKPEAIQSMEKALHDLDDDVGVAVLKTQYPQGAEKQQIFAVTGREVPSGGLPMDVGALVENVGTVAAIWNAVSKGTPLIERITTVTGTKLPRPGNIKSRIGTNISALLEHCGGIPADTAKVICGGPMMGFAQGSPETAVSKTTSGLLLLDHDPASTYSSSPCISCGRCVTACPTYLMPNELSQYLEAEDYEAAEQYSVLDCIECGCCAFECPARRPLVQHMRRGKAEVTLLRRAREAEEQTKKE